MPHNQLSEKDWKIKAKTIIRKEMANKNINFIELSKLLNSKLAISINPKSLSEKINRGTFSFYFGIQIFNVIGTNAIIISEIQNG